MRLTTAALALLLAAAASAQPALRDADRVRLAEAFALADDVQDAIWPGWSHVPFAVLLVTDEHEFLVGHPYPTDDFVEVVAHDSLLGGPVLTRPRQFSPTLLATFPAVAGVSTVVVGTPEATGRASTAWVVTLLHERLHQFQASRPGYYPAVEALDLSGGDETGMWMLNYPFPYADPAVGARFDAYRDALADALGAVYRPDAEAAVDSLLAARARLRDALSPADDRYLAFQQWQEGVARVAELDVAAAAAERHDPLPAFAALPDAIPYGAHADSLRAALADDLATADLATWGRVAFYPTGAAEAVLLDALRPGWRRRYTTDRFALPPVRERP